MQLIEIVNYLPKEPLPRLVWFKPLQLILDSVMQKESGVYDDLVILLIEEIESEATLGLF